MVLQYPSFGGLTDSSRMLHCIMNPGITIHEVAGGRR